MHLQQNQKQVELANLNEIASNKNSGGSSLLNDLPVALITLLGTPFLSGHIVPQDLFEIYHYVVSIPSLHVVWKFSRESDFLFESAEELVSYSKSVLKRLCTKPFTNGTIPLP